jgi:nucleoside-diphosphate kinase
MERTLAILKPDSVGAGNASRILAQLEEEGFRIVALKKLRLSRKQARAFYEVHKERPFYDQLVEFMTSGPVIPVALDRDDAVTHLREVMGATDSKQAAPGTVRALYGTDVQSNAIHGSDSAQNAALELAFFFSRAELLAAT